MSAIRIHPLLPLLLAGLGLVPASPLAAAGAAENRITIKRVEVLPREKSDYFLVKASVAYELNTLPEAVLTLSMDANPENVLLGVLEQKVARGSAEIELVTEVKRTSFDVAKVRASLIDPVPVNVVNNVRRMVAGHDMNFKVPAIGKSDRIDIKSIDIRPGKRPGLLLMRVEASYVLDDTPEASLVLYSDLYDPPAVFWQVAEQRITKGTGTAVLFAELGGSNLDRSTTSVKLELRRYPRAAQDTRSEPDRVVVRSKAMPRI